MNQLMFPIAEHESELSSLDINKFRTLTPIDSLYEENLVQLVRQTHVEHLNKGDVVFKVGDWSDDSVFLISGEILKVDESGQAERIRPGSRLADYAIDNHKQHESTVRVISETAVIASVDRELLDKLLTWGQIASEADTNDSSDCDIDTLIHSEWMMSMLQTNTFLKLPAGNIQILFEQLEEIPCQAGDDIVRKDEVGDYFYIIKQGRCRVTRRSGRTETILAELAENECFGEEALVSEAPRNATVTMLTDGKLMRLSKKSFQRLMEEPLLKRVSLKQAKREIRKREGILLDVRLEAEHEQHAIKGSINIPLYLLRLKMRRLNRKKRYILYCDTEARSSAAAFVLAHQGFDVAVLKEGLAALEPRSHAVAVA